MLRESEPDAAPNTGHDALPPLAEQSVAGSVAGSDVPPESEPEAVSRAWPIFKNRNFLILWSGQVFSQLADKIYLVLMIAIISTQFDRPGQRISLWVSAVMIAFTIPAVLFGSLAGVYVDRWSKKGTLVLTNLLRGGLVVALPALLWLAQDWGTIAQLPTGFGLLLVVTFLVSTLTQFFAPAEQAAIPMIVEGPNLLSANSLYTTTMMASVIIGFAVGEPFLAIADRILMPLDGGAGWGKAIMVGVGYGVAGLLLLALRIRKDQPPPALSPHPWQDIREGLRYLGDNSQVRGALLQLVLLFSVCAALAVLAVSLAEVMPAIKSSQFGFLLAGGGVGMALGAAAVGQFGQRFSRQILSLFGSLGMGLVLVALATVTTQFWPALALLVLLGFFAAGIGIPMQTMIQEQTPAEMRGKVFGLQNNVINIALSLPLVLASVAETLLGLPWVFIFLGALVAAGGLASWYASDRGADKMPSASSSQ